MAITPLKPDSSVFVNFSRPGEERVLHSGRVLETDPDTGTWIRLAAPEAGSVLEPTAAADPIEADALDDSPHGQPSPEAGTKPEHALANVERGQSALLFFEWNQRFSQQPNRVAEVVAEACGLRVSLLPTGRLSCAESRECFRVSAIASDLWAHLSDELRCEILDISATGFSAFVPEELPAGSLLEVTLSHAGESFRGTVRVKNTRRTPNGRLRCGFHCVEDRVRNQLLLGALPRINLALQREQLARRAGLHGTAPPVYFTPTRLRR